MLMVMEKFSLVLSIASNSIGRYFDFSFYLVWLCRLIGTYVSHIRVVDGKCKICRCGNLQVPSSSDKKKSLTNPGKRTNQDLETLSRWKF